MKKYICDACGESFDPKTAMADGWFKGSKEVVWKEVQPDGTGKDLPIIVIKTLKLYMKKPHDRECKKDLCIKCMGNIEKA